MLQLESRRPEHLNGQRKGENEQFQDSVPTMHLFIYLFNCSVNIYWAPTRYKILYFEIQQQTKKMVSTFMDQPAISLREKKVNKLFN